MPPEKSKKARTPQERSLDPAAQEMLIRADALGLDTAFSRAEQMAPCPIGATGSCCKLCFMGPCRLVKDGRPACAVRRSRPSPLATSPAPSRPALRPTPITAATLR